MEQKNFGKIYSTINYLLQGKKSWLNNKPPSYIHRGSNATLYLFQINAKIMETFTGGVDYFYKVFSKRKLLTSKNIKINQEI